jgi:hypothetical protein
MEEIAALISKGWTPGGAGIWVLVFLALGAWWKGLPAVLDAFANRQSKIEERMGKLLEDATARFARQIEAADQRHDECVKGQHELVAEVERLRRCVSEQQETIDGFRRKFATLQTSALRQEGALPSPTIEAMMHSLDAIKGPGE